MIIIFAYVNNNIGWFIEPNTRIEYRIIFTSIQPLILSQWDSISEWKKDCLQLEHKVIFFEMKFDSFPSVKDIKHWLQVNVPEVFL